MSDHHHRFTIMPTRERVLVQPAKYIIYEHELKTPESDSETACDEDWLSVTTIAETGSTEHPTDSSNQEVQSLTEECLQHVSATAADIETRASIEKYCLNEKSLTSQSSTSAASTMESPLSPAAEPESRIGTLSKYYVQEIPKFGCKALDTRLYPIARAMVVDESCEKQFEPLDRLLTLFQNLKAIYFVSASSYSLCFGPRSYEHWPAGLNIPLRGPVMVHIPHPRETYIAICVDCAAPPKVLYCDGSWTRRSGGWCKVHNWAMKVKCNHLPRSIDRVGCGAMNGQEIATLTMEVVQPWRRAKLTAAGITVFEYVSAENVDGHCEYAHREQCDCQGEKVEHSKSLGA